MKEHRAALKIRNAHAWVNKGVDAMCNLTALTTAIFLGALFFQVTMRYVFNNPIYGIDEAVTALMIWTMSLGFVEIYWKNENAVIEFIVARCPHFVRVIMNYITELIVLLMGIALVPTGIKLFTMQVKTIALGGLPFSKAYYYALPVTVMGAFLAVLAVFRLIEYTLTRDDSLLKASSEEGEANID